jgi:cell division protein FtsN
VQLGAFSSEELARALRTKATAAGLEARLVRMPGSSLLRVRVGLFSSFEEATVALARIQAMGFAAVVAQDVEMEEVVAR